MLMQKESADYPRVKDYRAALIQIKQINLNVDNAIGSIYCYILYKSS